jgi:hypothetical protein
LVSPTDQSDRADRTDQVDRSDQSEKKDRNWRYLKRGSRVNDLEIAFLKNLSEKTRSLGIVVRKFHVGLAKLQKTTIVTVITKYGLVSRKPAMGILVINAGKNSRKVEKMIFFTFSACIPVETVII